MTTRTLWNNHIHWAGLAAVTGLMIVAQPVITVVAVIVLAFGIIAASISPLAGLSFLLVLSPLRVLIATESSVQFPLDIGQILFMIFAANWAIWQVIRSKPLVQHYRTPLLLPLVGFILVSGLTLVNAFSVLSWLTEWMKWVTILVIVLIVLQMNDGVRWQWIVGGLVAAGTANALVGLYIFFGGSGADHLLINGRFFRAFGTFGQPNPFGGFMGLALPLSTMAAYGYLNRSVRIWRLTGRPSFRCNIVAAIYMITTIILLAGLVASWSRGAWLGFVMSSAAMAFALPRRLWQSVTLTGLVGIAVAVIWFSGLVPGAIQQRVTNSADDLFRFADVRGVDITTINYAVIERFAHWQAALNMARDYPWLGVGIGNYEAAYNHYRLINWDEPLGHAHNYYLNILAEAGMIGLVSYCGLWISIIWITWKARSHPDVLARSIAVGLFGAWVYLSVHSLLDNLYVNNLFIHLGVMLGLLAVLHFQTQPFVWTDIHYRTR